MATAKERPTGTRKEWKAAGRKMLRKNYLMIILLCLISIYFTGKEAEKTLYFLISVQSK